MRNQASLLLLLAFTGCREPEEWRPDTALQVIDVDADGVPQELDCDDNDPTRFPGNDELCDDVDHDCDGELRNDPADAVGYYVDSDLDGYGDARGEGIYSCDPIADLVGNNRDCADTSDRVHPDAQEVCNSIDDDCDGLIDDTDGSLDMSTTSTWYVDNDGDNYGLPSSKLKACIAPAGFILNGTDCNDNDSSEHPGAPEFCNGVDDDCDGVVDDDDITLELSSAETWFQDFDGDNFGAPGTDELACLAPTGFVDNDDDCDDDNADVNPTATERCNDIDDDCDTLIDNDDPSVTTTCPD